MRPSATAAASFSASSSTSCYSPSPSGQQSLRSPSRSGSPFWLPSCSALSTRSRLVYPSGTPPYATTQTNSVRDIALARLRDGPRHSSSYAVPLSNSDIGMLTYNSPRLRPRNSLPEDSPPTDAFRLRPVSEDVQQNALYQRMLEERPLPPIPARNPSRPSIYSAVLASPLSDPFINDSALPQPIRLSAREGGVTIRQVPPSSCMFSPVVVVLSTPLTISTRCFAHLSFHSFYNIASPLGGRTRPSYDIGTMRTRIGQRRT